MEKLGQIYDKISQIEIILAKQQSSLDEHMRRTHLLETQTDELKKFVYKTEGGLKLLFAALTLIEIVSKLWK